MEECCFDVFGSKSKLTVMSLLEKGDHPELDTSQCLDQDGIQKNQSIIGAIQLSVSLGLLKLVINE